MKILLQRVKKASVSSPDFEKRDIGEGVVLFVGIGTGDKPEDIEKLANRIAQLRIFPKENSEFNVSLVNKELEALSISQFTLYADCRSGRRPDFSRAEKPPRARELYDMFNNRLREKSVRVKTGEFGAKMLVEIHNDGPVTLILDEES